MPKLKTNSSAKKRFALTGSGKIKRKHAFKSHILTKKTKKQKRNLTYFTTVDQADVRSSVSASLREVSKPRLFSNREVSPQVPARPEALPRAAWSLPITKK